MPAILQKSDFYPCVLLGRNDTQKLVVLNSIKRPFQSNFELELRKPGRFTGTPSHIGKHRNDGRRGKWGNVLLLWCALNPNQVKHSAICIGMICTSWHTFPYPVGVKHCDCTPPPFQNMGVWKQPPRP